MQQLCAPLAAAAPGLAPPRRCRHAFRAFASSNGAAGNSKHVTTVHRLVEAEGAIIVPGVYDALSAKIAQRAGHKAGFVSGAAVSATLLGEPDLGLITPPEMARKTGQIVSSTDRALPIIADADTGGGNVLNVQRTVASLMAAGAAGCVLEDQVWPKRSGAIRGREVVGMEEFVSKIVAAREVVGDADFCLIARTDARGLSAAHGLEDAIARANLYVEAGADGSLVEAPRSVDELRIVAEKTEGLRVVNIAEGGVTPMCSLDQLRDWGFHVVIYPMSGLYAATRALGDVYGALHASGSSRECWDQMVSWRAFNEIVELEGKYQSEQELTAIRGPASRLRVRVKAPVKPLRG